MGYQRARRKLIVVVVIVVVAVIMKVLVFSLLLLITVSCFEARGYRRANSRRRGGKKLDPEVQKVITDIWNNDHNRAEYGKDFELCYQGHIEKGDKGDKAAGPLVCKFDEELLQRPTYKAFHALFDNYNRVEGQEEDITPQEIEENNQFLNLVLQTHAMKTVHELLVRKGRASADEGEFKQKLYTLWFGPYGRRQKSPTKDSSGFEHVFMGEINGRKHNIGGFHNWLHLHNEEQGKHLNYLGYLKHSDNPLIFNFRFNWYKTLKPLGSAFFGTSPEFEFSLYSLIYMMGYSHAKIVVDGMNINITCFPINHNNNIGTCYPSIL